MRVRWHVCLHLCPRSPSRREPLVWCMLVRETPNQTSRCRPTAPIPPPLGDQDPEGNPQATPLRAAREVRCPHPQPVQLRRRHKQEGDSSVLLARRCPRAAERDPRSLPTEDGLRLRSSCGQTGPAGSRGGPGRGAGGTRHIAGGSPVALLLLLRPPARRGQRGARAAPAARSEPRLSLPAVPTELPSAQEAILFSKPGRAAALGVLSCTLQT